MELNHQPRDFTPGDSEFADFPDFPDVPARETTAELAGTQLEFSESEVGSAFMEPQPADWNLPTDPFSGEFRDSSPEPGSFGMPVDGDVPRSELTQAEAVAAAANPAIAAPVRVKQAARPRTPRIIPVKERVDEAAQPLDRLTDYKSSYVARHLDVLAAEARASETLVQVLVAEERLGGGLTELLDRAELLVERAERAEAALTLSKDTLREQAQFIARAFKVQLTETEADGRATLLTHILEVGDRAANAATKALNDSAEEAAAFAGVKAESAALQRVTQAVVEQAQASGLDAAIRVLVNASGRVTTAVERLEAASVAPSATTASMTEQQFTPPGIGALPLAYLWAKHHLGAPGAFIGLVVTLYGLYRFFVR